jgi:hypothetical protein
LIKENKTKIKCDITLLKKFSLQLKISSIPSRVFPLQKDPSSSLPLSPSPVQPFHVRFSLQAQTNKNIHCRTHHDKRTKKTEEKKKQSEHARATSNGDKKLTNKCQEEDETKPLGIMETMH